ncbi:MAG TPA: peptidylprolyl isomerase [Pirellulaceae bacterium]|jgi:cyclophilin family peptidyl-prolyl cis-trans isomerase|nr:peptidylprolyl isomerase [Pirellulaceae bacterium]
MKTTLRYALSFVLSLSLASFAAAQDSAAPGGSPPASQAAPPAGEPAAPGDPAAPAAEGPVAAFEAAANEWMQLDKDLSAALEEVRTTQGEARAAAIDDYKAVVARQEEALPKLVAAAEAALAADPENLAAKRVLIGSVAHDVRSDDNDDALAQAQKLIQSGVDRPVVYDLAAVAAYGLDQFDLAADYLAKAGEAAQQLSSTIADDVPTAQKLWTEEQKIRQAEAAKDDLPRVKVVTDAGEMVIELYEDQAPNTVANFISLAEKGFYDGLTFHRVLPNFMAQGGDPDGTGGGGPGYTIVCEVDRPGARNHFAGTLSMAHAGKDTGGSQFFITFRRTPHLDGRHTAFGRVIEGQDVLAELQRRDPSSPGPKPEPSKIVKMEVLRKRDHAYQPKTTPER